MKPDQLETGAASLRIELAKGHLTVFHGTDGNRLLKRRPVPEGFWQNRLWSLLAENKSRRCYVITFNERNGEQEYVHHVAVELKPRQAVTRVARRLARDWYGENEGEWDSGMEVFEHLGGCIHVSIDGWRKVTPLEFDILSRYL